MFILLFWLFINSLRKELDRLSGNPIDNSEKYIEWLSVDQKDMLVDL